MDRIIGVTELQRKFRTVFDEVVRNRTPYILTRGSRPEAVLVPYDEYLEYTRAHEQEVHARYDAMLKRMERLNAKFTDEQVEHDLEEVSRLVRAGHNARERSRLYKGSADSRRERRAKK